MTILLYFTFLTIIIKIAHCFHSFLISNIYKEIKKFFFHIISNIYKKFVNIISLLIAYISWKINRNLDSPKILFPYFIFKMIIGEKMKFMTNVLNFVRIIFCLTVWKIKKIYFPSFSCQNSVIPFFSTSKLIVLCNDHENKSYSVTQLACLSTCTVPECAPNTPLIRSRINYIYYILHTFTDLL